MHFRNFVAGCLFALSIYVFGTDFAEALENLGPAIRSSDQLFEAYRTADFVTEEVNGTPIGCGTKLYLRPAGMKTQGALLCENGRYMAIQWCPNADLLGVENHWDGHSSYVDVFEVRFSKDHRNVIYKLVFRSPDDAYNRKWFIEGWDSLRRVVRLRLEQTREGGGDIVGEENWPPGDFVRHFSFSIGTEALRDTNKP